MPRGRGPHGRGRGGGRRMLFLQAALLVRLKRAHDYGYSLVEGLGEFGIEPGRVDISIVYRALRQLEAAGLIDGTWAEESRGPQRRIYRVTAAGDEALAVWMEELHQRRRELEALEAAYTAVRREPDA